jgi:hypothetical protein
VEPVGTLPFAKDVVVGEWELAGARGSSLSVSLSLPSDPTWQGRARAGWSEQAERAVGPRQCRAGPVAGYEFSFHFSFYFCHKF